MPGAVSLLADIRRIVVWVLGVALIFDAILGSDDAIPELIVGLVMVGVLPLEDVVMTYARARGEAAHPPDASTETGGDGGVPQGG